MHLDAAAEWHPTRNSGLELTDLRPASNKKVWWQCSEGHQWQVSPPDTIRCIFRSFAEKRVPATFPQIISLRGVEERKGHG